jgi:diguanylate cyclase (GGDEF)-like protein
LAVGGTKSLLALVFGAHPHGLDVIALGAFELTAAALIFLIPWARLPAWATVSVAVVGLVAVAWSELLGLIPDAANGVPFVIVFAWVAAHQPRPVAWGLLPLAGFGFAVAQRNHSGGVDVRAVLLILGACIIVAEVIGRVIRSEARASARTQRAVTSFRVVAQASAELHELEPEAVLSIIVGTVIELGYDGAALAVVDERTSTFAVTHAIGSSTPHQGRVLGLDEGLAGYIRRTGEPARGAELARFGLAPPAHRDVVAAPVICGGSVIAVLYGSYERQRTRYVEDLEAMRMLAATAATALDNANRFVRERQSALHHAAAALTDQLTGVGNRRRADEALSTLTRRDTLVMIDLDHFKAVNDDVGHAAGDELLRQLASHLVHGVRDLDQVLRYGGEEFLLVLRDLDASQAERLVQRLLVSWRETTPPATFSAGIAQHFGGRAAATVERADQAMYAAKAAGRDTYRAAVAAPIVVPVQAGAPHEDAVAFG